MRKRQITMMGMLLMTMLAGVSIAWADQVLRQAQITKMNGQVEWLKAGSSDWQPAVTDQKLDGGDKLRVSKEGNATLTLDEGSTIELSGESEFAVQKLTKDSATDRMESILAVMKGKIKANVTPLKGGSTFEVETPVVVAAVLGTTFNVGINPADGTVGVSSDAGAVSLSHKGPNHFTAKVDSGESLSIFSNPGTGEIRITNTSSGPLKITGPDGAEATVGPGQTVIFQNGAATFIPNPIPNTAPPGPNGANEPANPQDTPASGV